MFSRAFCLITVLYNCLVVAAGVSGAVERFASLILPTAWVPSHKAAAEYHQHYDVGQTMADIPLAGSAEIGDGGSEIHQFSQNAATEFGFIL